MSLCSSTHLNLDNLGGCLLWQMAQDFSWDPGLSALCSCCFWLCWLSAFQPEGEESMAAMWQGWTLGWGRLHSVSVFQRTHPHVTSAYSGIMCKKKNFTALDLYYFLHLENIVDININHISFKARFDSHSCNGESSISFFSICSFVGVCVPIIRIIQVK